MKKYKSLIELLLIATLFVVSVISVAPKTFVMPNTAQMVLMVLVIGLLCAFLVFIWRENPSDEREAQNQATASRAAYIVGAGVLIVTLLVQGLQHDLDPAIPLVLLAMISTKLAVQRFKDGF